MRRPQYLTPAWFWLVAALAVVGGILTQVLDGIRGSDESFRWSGVIVFAVVFFVVQVGVALWLRRRPSGQRLS